MVLEQNEHVHNWNRIMNPEINPYIYSHLIFAKGAKNTNVVGKTGYSHIKNGTGPLSYNTHKN